MMLALYYETLGRNPGAQHGPTRTTADLVFCMAAGGKGDTLHTSSWDANNAPSKDNRFRLVA